MSYFNSELNRSRTKKEIMQGIESNHSRIRANNTVEYYKGAGLQNPPDRVIRFHLTDIVTFKPDESYILNSGTWRTMITKERMNTFSPARVWAEKGIWYVNGKVFYDGIHFDKEGKLLSKELPDPAKSYAKIKRKIAKFVKGVDTLAELPRPEAGDCWVCQFKKSDCLESHIEENYLHGSLIIRALEFAGHKPEQYPYIFHAKWQVKNALRKFLTKTLIPDIAV